MGELFFSVFFYLILFGILYGTAALLVGATAAKKYHDDWVVSKATQIYEGAMNIGLGICLLMEDSRAGITALLVDLFEFERDAAEMLYLVLAYVGAMALAIGIGTICWAIFEGIYRCSRKNGGSFGEEEPSEGKTPQTFDDEFVIEETVCPACSSKVEASDFVCSYCGHQLKERPSDRK